jgi:hypothetical protein
MVVALHRKEVLTGIFIQESQIPISGTLWFVLQEISPCPFCMAAGMAAPTPSPWAQFAETTGIWGALAYI